MTDKPEKMHGLFSVRSEGLICILKGQTETKIKMCRGVSMAKKTNRKSAQVVTILIRCYELDQAEEKPFTTQGETKSRILQR